MGAPTQRATDYERTGDIVAMGPWQALANAIVLQAVEDYRTELSGSRCHKHRSTRAKRIRELEQFFRSHWYETLTNIDGEMLMAKIRREYEDA